MRSIVYINKRLGAGEAAWLQLARIGKDEELGRNGKGQARCYTPQEDSVRLNSEAACSSFTASDIVMLAT